MTDELEVGKTYTVEQLGQMLGGIAITSEDRIVTDELLWERMTVRRLRTWLAEALAIGAIDDDTVVMVDSDPESNAQHPMRACVLLGEVIEPERGVHPGFRPEPSMEVRPAAAVLFGVGY